MTDAPLQAGAGWASSVQETLTALTREWGITIGRQLTGGTASHVVEVITASGEPAVLKVSVPSVDFVCEVRTLRAAGGRGYARVLAADVSRNAVLLEPLGGSLSASGLSPVDQLSVLAGLLPLAWAVPRTEDPFDKATWLADFIAPYGPSPVVDEALRCAARRSAAYDPSRCVVLHGDAAAANVLARPGEGWVFVDPDGFVGDPAYDRGVATRDWCTEILAASDPRALLRSYCEVLGGDVDATWDFAYLERVSTGLFLRSLGGDGSPHLHSAAALLD